MCCAAGSAGSFRPLRLARVWVCRSGSSGVTGIVTTRMGLPGLWIGVLARRRASGGRSTRLVGCSVKRVVFEKIVWMLGQYRTHHMGWNVKHFHEHLRRQHDFGWGYTWTKLQLHAAGLVERANRRGPHRHKRLGKAGGGKE